jgi:hypothetical protein
MPRRRYPGFYTVVQGPNGEGHSACATHWIMPKPSPMCTLSYWQRVYTISVCCARRVRIWHAFVQVSTRFEVEV